MRSLEPSGFIFHESRVGSTLLANILASSEPNLVYSEPHLPFLALRQCRGYDTHHTALECATPTVKFYRSPLLHAFA